MNLKTLEDTATLGLTQGCREDAARHPSADPPSESDLLLATSSRRVTSRSSTTSWSTRSYPSCGATNSEQVRGRAAIYLGPVLEHADTGGCEDTDDLPIAERTFHRDPGVAAQPLQKRQRPPRGRRRILEASVRARGSPPGCGPRPYASDDEAWRLTAVFCMRFVRRFDEQILEALGGKNRYPLRGSSVRRRWGMDGVAARRRAVAQARPQAAAPGQPSTPRPASVRTEPQSTSNLADSDDEDIVAAVEEAMTGAEVHRGRGRRLRR